MSGGQPASVCNKVVRRSPLIRHALEQIYTLTLYSVDLLVAKDNAPTKHDMYSGIWFSRTSTD